MIKGKCWNQFPFFSPPLFFFSKFQTRGYSPLGFRSKIRNQQSRRVLSSTSQIYTHHSSTSRRNQRQNIKGRTNTESNAWMALLRPPFNIFALRVMGSRFITSSSSSTIIRSRNLSLSSPFSLSRSSLIFRPRYPLPPPPILSLFNCWRVFCFVVFFCCCWKKQYGYNLPQKSNMVTLSKEEKWDKIWVSVWMYSKECNRLLIKKKKKKGV